MWQVRSTEEFDEWLAEIDDQDVRIEIVSEIDFLRTMGPSLGRPHIDTLNGSRHANMKELRVRKPRSAIRIAFAFDPQRRAILLTAGNKSGVSSDRFYKRLIRKADELYDRYLETLKKGK